MTKKSQKEEEIRVYWSTTVHKLNYDFNKHFRACVSESVRDWD